MICKELHRLVVSHLCSQLKMNSGLWHLNSSGEWINSSPPSAAYMRQWTGLALVQHWSPTRRQAITWTNAALLSIEVLGTNFSEILIKIQNSTFMEMHLKMSSVKWRPCCPGGDELRCMALLDWFMQNCTYPHIFILYTIIHTHMNDETSSYLLDNEQVNSDLTQA